ncbi:hypothetical protein EST38_g472 [Candolleomyces aberdarensis]|uniref:Uncharacterized protein n=1 Tax=Candolleomyces aberdarensis TaxID=2316362 RepID=A0A4Q2DX93_9AGAR|nr:hypothetical protein EST38_g472 [Candolleomyces aberdarensis]
MIQFRDGPFIRPHPAFWRIILGVNLLYELVLVFLLFQDLPTARQMMTFIDPSLGRPLPEKSYAEDCSLTPTTLWNAIDIFCLAHALGWFGKAMILRDYWFCWNIVYSTNFQILQSVGGTIGSWTFYSAIGSGHTSWGTATSFLHYTTVVLLLAVFLAAELNPFYLKSLLWMEPDHPIVILRLAFIFLWALPAVRELYQYINDPRRAVRMGQHVWLLLATVITELLVITKWSKGQFPEPLPPAVKWGWSVAAVLVVLYPAVQFGLPSARRYLRKHGRKAKAA